MSLTPRQLGEQLRQRKQQRQPIAVLTAWDALSASWAEAAGVDLVLVGDSLAMVALGHAETLTGQIIGFIGVLLGAGNAVGGYVVTERMLEMFKPSEKKEAED